jgi:hypothetical protein
MMQDKRIGPSSYPIPSAFDGDALSLHAKKPRKTLDLPRGAPPRRGTSTISRRTKAVPYVGLLNIAELHDATRRTAMEFQVVIDKRLPAIRAGTLQPQGYEGGQHRHRRLEDRDGSCIGPLLVPASFVPGHQLFGFKPVI